MTTTATPTLQGELDKADPNTLPDAIRQIALGTMVTPLKAVFTGLASGAAHDITDDAHGNLPKILSVTTLRVTAGLATNGPRLITDVSGTASPPNATNGHGVATLSDDGATITFDQSVTAFVIEYIPRAETDPTGAFTRT